MRRVLVLLVAMLVASSCGSSESTVPATEPTATAVPTSEPAETAEQATQPEATQPEPTATPTKQRDNTTDEDSAGREDSVAEDSVAEIDPALLGADAPRTGDIRDVDFYNGFGYPVSFGEEVIVTVSDGLYEDEPGFLWFAVSHIEYGDLDDDGTDEAVVQTSFNTGGSGQFGRLAVWDIVDDRVVERGWIGTGDRADGGLWHFEIRDGQIVAENFLTDQGACCPNMLTQQRLALVSDGLVHVEHVRPLRWMPLNSYDDADTELKFLPDTSAAVLQLSAIDETSEVLFEANAGQWVTTTRRHGAEAGVVIFDEAGNVVGQSANTNLEVELTTSGFFRIVFTNDVTADRATAVDLSITAHPLPDPATWTPVVRELIVDDEPLVRLLTMTPKFDLSDNGLLNGAIDAWMGSQTDWWVADVIEYPPVEREGSDASTGGEYELLYDVTLAADDLVSFRWHWYEYVCCRPRPNTGHASLVIDLAERRIIEVDEILDLDRLDEIHDIWITRAAAEETLPDDFLVWWGVDGPSFTSLALTPTGVEFGTDRLGAVGGTTTVVPYADLGDLVNADLVARARTGSEPIRLAEPVS